MKKSMMIIIAAMTALNLSACSAVNTIKDSSTPAGVILQLIEKKLDEKIGNKKDKKETEETARETEAEKIQETEAVKETEGLPDEENAEEIIEKYIDGALEEIYAFDENDNLVSTTTTTRTYDIKGNVIAETQVIEYADGRDAETNTYEYSIIYNDEGLVEELESRNNGEFLQNEKYTYNDKGDAIVLLRETPFATYTFTRELEYDDLDLLVRSSNENAVFNNYFDMKYHETYEYTYNENYMLLTEELVDRDGEGAMVSDYIEHKYNPEGVLIAENRYLINGGGDEETIITIYNYEYNPDGTLDQTTTVKLETYDKVTTRKEIITNYSYKELS